jgi:hypothetical protein
VRMIVARFWFVRALRRCLLCRGRVRYRAEFEKD